MGTIEDIRKLLQDLVTPDLKAIRAEIAGDREAAKLREGALAARLDAMEQTSKMRDDALAASLASKVELLLGRMDAQHSTVINALALDKRVENIERQMKSTESVPA